MIEAMVAMGIISVGLLGVFSVLSNSLGISKVTSNQYVGTYLAAEGIEVVKNIIDTNVGQHAWNQYLDSNGDYAVEYDSVTLDSVDQNKPLLFDPSTGLYSYKTGNPTVFTREITINNILNDNELQVNSIVSWSDQGGIKDSVNLEDDFYNFRTPPQ
jgi:hypothetical protein